MKPLTHGFHHLSLKANSDEEYARTREFYCGILGMQTVREWQDGVLIDTGNGLLELFRGGNETPVRGVLRHVAFLTDSADACAEAVSAAGYEVFIGPKDAQIPSDPPYPIRIAFCRGPLGEEIEFLQEL